MVAEAAKYDASLITGTEQAKTAGGPPLNLRSGSVALDPVTHQPIYQNPVKQDVYNPDTGRTETRWVTPATSGSGLPVVPPTNGGAGGPPQTGALPSSLWTAQQYVESHFDPKAISPTGATGPAQFMPATAAQYGGNGTAAQKAYMGDLYKKYGNMPQALIAYNWGPGNTDAWIKAGGDPQKLPAETQSYLNKVLDLAGGSQGPQNSAAAPSNQNSLPSGPSVADTEAQKGYTQQRLNFEQGVQPTLIGIQRMTAIADALKQFKSGWGAEHMATVNAVFKRLGMDPINSVAPDQFQIVLKNNFQAAVSQMQKYSSNPAAVSLSQAIDNFANGDLQPEANLAILAQGIGTSKWQLDATKAMQDAKLGGTQDPNAFFLDWADKHPMQGYIDQATKDIGPLKGMEGAGPQGAPAPAGVTKVWNFDASGKLVPAQ